ncbi:MAG: hypothetical protein ABIB79_02415 [archaeon]
MKKISKTEAKKEIKEFFKDIQSKSPKNIKKIKRFAMRHNIPLNEFRKQFCRKCLVPYKNPKIRIRKGIKSVKCIECGYIARWKMK